MEKNEIFPPWRDEPDYVVDKYGQSSLYWRSGGKRIVEDKERKKHE